MKKDALQPFNTLAWIQQARALPVDYKPITHERAEQLTDLIVPVDEDAEYIALALIELLRGIASAAFEGRDYEGIVTHATHRAYSKTMHFEHAFNTFSCLSLEDESDKKVLMREYDGEGVEPCTKN